MIGFIIVRNVGSWPAKAFVWGRVKQKFTYAFLARFLIKNKQTLHYLKPQNKTTIIKKTLLNEKKKRKKKRKDKEEEAHPTGNELTASSTGHIVTIAPLDKL